MSWGASLTPRSCGRWTRAGGRGARYQQESERVSLGLKQKQENPWENIDEKFPSAKGFRQGGQSHAVRRVCGTGAGRRGLVHVTELSWTKRINKPSEVLKADQEIEAVVLGINRDEQKISLGVRQLNPTRGIWLRRSTRSAQRSPARFAALPVMVPSWGWRKVSMQ